MTEDKVLKMDKEMKNLWFDEGHTLSPRPAMKKMWEDIRNNTSVLTYATKLNDDGTDFLTPTLASLILLDYENVDPIAYDVITNIIYDKSFLPFFNRDTDGIHKVVPFFLKDYNLTYLVATLFNDNLYLTEERKDFLINISKLCYGSPDFAVNYYWGVDTAILRQRYANFQGKYPIDIRYFVLEHPAFKDVKDKLVKDFFVDVYANKIVYNSIKDYQNLMKDYETRARLRELKKLPF